MKQYILPIIAFTFAFVYSGCSPIEHDLIGKWKTTSDLKESGGFDSVGWEIEFRSNGKFQLLSDNEMDIQNWRTGRFQILEDIVSIEYFHDGEAIDFEYRLEDQGDTLSLNGEFWDLRLFRSDEPHAALRALPRMPESLREATALLISELSEEDKHYIATRKQDDLISFHMGWGTGIRNRFGLWSGNKKLLASCGHRWMHPDDASSVIIDSVWETLRDGLDTDFLAGVTTAHSVSDTVKISAFDLDGLKFAGLAEIVNEAIADAYPDVPANDRVVFEVAGDAEWLTLPLYPNRTLNEVLSLSHILHSLTFLDSSQIIYEPGKITLAGPESGE